VAERFSPSVDFDEGLFCFTRTGYDRGHLAQRGEHWVLWRVGKCFNMLSNKAGRNIPEVDAESTLSSDVRMVAYEGVDAGKC
jgi:hypothetical protein